MSQSRVKKYTASAAFLPLNHLITVKPHPRPQTKQGYSPLLHTHQRAVSDLQFMSIKPSPRVLKTRPSTIEKRTRLRSSYGARYLKPAVLYKRNSEGRLQIYREPRPKMPRVSQESFNHALHNYQGRLSLHPEKFADTLEAFFKTEKGPLSPIEQSTDDGIQLSQSRVKFCDESLEEIVHEIIKNT